MNKNQFRGALATILGAALIAGTIGTSQAETMTKPSAGSTMTKPTAKPTSSSPKPTASPAGTTTSGSTIVDLAVGSQQFTTLVAAVKAAGLVETLGGPGPFTLFAPNDQAFEKIPKAIRKKLLDPKNKAVLQKILKYHLLSGEVMAKDVKTGSVATVAGSKIKIVVDANGVKINGAKTIKTDIKASNGVIHTIDTVLVPSDVNLSKLK
jgi:uncharacterized surface protein with fasciclin (FAS1) repeats